MQRSRYEEEENKKEKGVKKALLGEERTRVMTERNGLRKYVSVCACLPAPNKHTTIYLKRTKIVRLSLKL